MLTYVGDIRPNGLMELAKCLRQEQVVDNDWDNDCLTYGGNAKQGNDQHDEQVPVGKGADACVATTVTGSEHGACAHDDQIGRVLRSSDPTLVARLRLRARLHLEVLRVMEWCFFMLGSRSEEHAKVIFC